MNKLIKKIQAKVKRAESVKVKEGETRKEAYSMHWQKRNEVFKDCNGKATFDPSEFVGKSYGYWNVVQKINGKVVFNWYKYSNTTTGHQWTLYRLIEQLGIKIDAEVHCHGGLQHFKEEALYTEYEKLLKLQLFGHRTKHYTAGRDKNYKPIKKKYTAEMLKKEIKAQYKKIKLLRSLGAEFKKTAIDAMRKDMIADDVARLAEMKVKRDERAAQRKALKPALVSTEAINFQNDALNSTENINF